MCIKTDDAWLITLVSTLKSDTMSEDFKRKNAPAKLSLIAETIGGAVYSSNPNNPQAATFRKSMETISAKLVEESYKHEKDLVNWYLAHLKEVYKGDSFGSDILSDITTKMALY